jgi:hypothetical protein
VLIHRKLEKLALGGSTERSRNSGIQEPHDSLEHPVRSGRIAAMNPKDPAAETQHHRPVGVGDDSINLSQPELLKPRREALFQ